MASLQERSGSSPFISRFCDKPYLIVLGKVSRDEADAKSAQVE